jgi:hypothetical protein
MMGLSIWSAASMYCWPTSWTPGGMRIGTMGLPRWDGPGGGGGAFGAGAAMPSVGCSNPSAAVIVLGLLLVVGFTAWREAPQRSLGGCSG